MGFLFVCLLLLCFGGLFVFVFCLFVVVCWFLLLVFCCCCCLGGAGVVYFVVVGMLVFVLGVDFFDSFLFVVIWGLLMTCR